MALITNTTVNAAPVLAGSSTVITFTGATPSGDVSQGAKTGTVNISNVIFGCSDSDVFKIDFRKNGVSFGVLYVSKESSTKCNISSLFTGQGFSFQITRIGSGVADVQAVILYTLV